MNTVVQIENNTRRKFLFDSYTRVKRPDGSLGALERDKARSFVLGDSADKVLPAGAVRGPMCPSPIVRMSHEMFGLLDERVHQVLQALDDAGDITIIPDLKVDENGDTHKRPAGVSLRDRVLAFAGGKPAAPAQPQQPAAPATDGKGRR